MSDIYLQITETPTVVTLSAPVISGALSSTVTVANTVTVALDSNSLSALENVTVTVGAAITGTVTVSNFPASQAVTFSAVTISNFPSTQTIAGTVTANLGSALPAGTNRIGVVTIGAGTVTIGSGTAQIGSVTASLSGWELLGQRDFFADASNWQFNSSVIGLYSSLGITFGDGSSGSIQANNLTNFGQENDLYWSSLDGTRTRIISSGTGLHTTIAIPAEINISVFLAPSSSQTASLYGKKDNALPLTNTQLRGSALTIAGTVTANPTGTQTIAGSVTLGAGTAQIGSVTASINGTVPVSGTFWQATQPVSLAATTVTISANPAGPLTTRFGSVTTANTSQLTTAVTNTSRKYLFTQNISTGIVTIGIGFSPTTTQGIQLSAGSGIVFDSFCPTGAVYWLGATTGAAWSILEG